VIVEEVSLESCEVLEEFLDTWRRCKLWLIPLIFLHHLSSLSHYSQGVIHCCSVAGCSSAIVVPSEERERDEIIS